MAIVGVSKPMYAIYSDTNGTPTYSNGGVLGKMVEVSIDIESSEDNNLYADNGIAETDRSFTGGTFTMTTDDMSDEVSQAILGVRAVEIEGIEGLAETGVKELIFDNTQQTPYLGVGFIIKKVVGGVNKWRAVVLTRVMFSVPATAATTQGETIEWQTPELTGTITRDASPTQVWKIEATFATEADAALFIKTRLNITEPKPVRTVSASPDPLPTNKKE